MDHKIYHLLRCEPGFLGEEDKCPYCQESKEFIRSGYEEKDIAYTFKCKLCQGLRTAVGMLVSEVGLA